MGENTVMFKMTRVPRFSPCFKIMYWYTTQIILTTFYLKYGLFREPATASYLKIEHITQNTMASVDLWNKSTLDLANFEGRPWEIIQDEAPRNIIGKCEHARCIQDTTNIRGTFHWNVLFLIPTWISNNMPSKLWGEYYLSTPKRQWLVSITCYSGKKRLYSWSSNAYVITNTHTHTPTQLHNHP